MFDWGKRDLPDGFGKKANQFFGFFGTDFKKQIETELEPKQNEPAGDKENREKIVSSIYQFLDTEIKLTNKTTFMRTKSRAA